ncbi:pyridoxamine 5'-phosphate oxidase family protein [Ostreibacterium oceani]|uniref:Pyridoxamine 5'-phosphate oxidase family protein n=1 Tax=Ostreibacterium oceani TaxID=2654998 RepID=A0A6N7ETE7_9GAMM|nr:pyridoxamine 5'-phosphate oxidase family protein [Ostreibacterium oceani]MPV85203.1 pyridoxamine 5'-phosphate oxidase family protein [Ostreibacterium oceani]
MKNSSIAVRQARQRAHYDQETLYDIIDAALMAVVSVTIDAKPIAIPMVIARIDNAIYLHGSNQSRLMKHLASGAPVCICIAHLDGLVVARSGMHCSANYRSAVIHGQGTVIADEDKAQLLYDIVERIIPNSRHDFREHLAKEVKATTLIAIELDQFACKIRTGRPKDDDADLNLPYWAGVIPVEQNFGAPIDAPDLPESIETPAYAINYRRHTSHNV